MKIKAFKRQVEEAEEIAALNLAKFRQVSFLGAQEFLICCAKFRQVSVLGGTRVSDLLWGTSSVSFCCNTGLVIFLRGSVKFLTFCRA